METPVVSPSATPACRRLYPVDILKGLDWPIDDRLWKILGFSKTFSSTSALRLALGVEVQEILDKGTPADQALMYENIGRAKVLEERPFYESWSIIDTFGAGDPWSEARNELISAELETVNPNPDALPDPDEESVAQTLEAVATYVAGDDTWNSYYTHIPKDIVNYRRAYQTGKENGAAHSKEYGLPAEYQPRLDAPQMLQDRNLILDMQKKSTDGTGLETLDQATTMLLKYLGCFRRMPPVSAKVAKGEAPSVALATYLRLAAKAYLDLLKVTPEELDQSWNEDRVKILAALGKGADPGELHTVAWLSGSKLLD